MRLPRLLHSGHLERFLGTECVSHISDASRCAAFPQYVANVPGDVVAVGGDFYGYIQPTVYGLRERTLDAIFTRRRPGEGVYVPPLPDASPALRAYLGASMGFASRSDAISEATSGGKLQSLLINKVGVTGVAAAHNTLWFEGNVPAAGSAGANLAAGTNCTRTTTGAIGPQTNAAGGDTLHLAGAQMLGTVGANTLMLYDRLWHGVIDRTVSTTQTVTMTPPRYATTDSVGNFAFVEIQVALPATAHNITLQYVDQDGNAAENAAALAGISSGIAKRLDHTPWCVPLNAGDTGFRDLTQITLSATLASGTIQLVAGHFLGYLPCPVANTMPLFDFLSGPLNPPRIQDDACLSLLEVSKGATTATTYNGAIVLLSG